MLAGNAVRFLNAANSASTEIKCDGGARLHITSYNQTMATFEQGSSIAFYTNNGQNRLQIANDGDITIAKDLQAGSTIVAYDASSTSNQVRARIKATAANDDGRVGIYYGGTEIAALFGKWSGSQFTSGLNIPYEPFIVTGAGGAERFRINADGRFSLGNGGNATPSAAFHLDYDTNNLLMLDNSTASTQKIFFAQNASTHAQIYATSNTGALTIESDPSNNHGSSFINFRVDNNEAFRIKNDGSLRAYTTANGVSCFSNSEHGNVDFNHRGGRVLTSNGTGWDGNASGDGTDPILVLAVENRAGNSDISDAYGLCLHSESQDDNDYGPMIGWSNLSNSGSYNTTYAAIVGQKTGQSTDHNWSAGALHFFTNKPGTCLLYTSPSPRDS